MATKSLPPDWNLVLEKILGTLTQALQNAENRDTALISTPSKSPGEAEDLFGVRLQELESRADKARKAMLELDQVFQEEETATRQHLGAVAEVGKKITAWLEGKQPLDCYANRGFSWYPGYR